MIEQLGYSFSSNSFDNSINTTTNVPTPYYNSQAEETIVHMELG